MAKSFYLFQLHSMVCAVIQIYVVTLYAKINHAWHVMFCFQNAYLDLKSIGDCRCNENYNYIYLIDILLLFFMYSLFPFKNQSR